ncbi:uncharacterized protein IL334_002359 [Kwoniella shivajii]|uniref:Uncharacterized protein n=1 Tax=Kwoniella shivajii TaxID=564305 RepID=A0ABZ1CUV9_9TREE|nr:hypothetical protein IL334_002359 [Kwoniella shivajii]
MTIRRYMSPAATEPNLFSYKPIVWHTDNPQEETRSQPSFSHRLLSRNYGNANLRDYKQVRFDEKPTFHHYNPVYMQPAQNRAVDVTGTGKAVAWWNMNGYDTFPIAVETSGPFDEQITTIIERGRNSPQPEQERPEIVKKRLCCATVVLAYWVRAGAKHQSNRILPVGGWYLGGNTSLEKRHF